MLKLNKLLYSGSDEVVFYDRIQPTEDQKQFLFACKNEIREHLRPRITAATVAVLGMEKAVVPRFRTQGSWSYKTCVIPVCTPPQEMDWDYGVYLPVHVWEKNGPPQAMAKAYFKLVETLLVDLCKQKGWHLVAGKNTCIRIQVSNWAHIDVPLYAAPEDKFQLVQERVLLEASNQKSFSMDSADAAFSEMPEQQWEDLEDIVMATREGEWKASDPEAVARWFNDQLVQHGEQLRRVSRYLKAWRDFNWQEGGGPTSVSIMIAIAQTFEAQPRRDDLALEKAAHHLANAIAGELREIAIDGGAEDFNGRLNDTEKLIASRNAKALESALYRARGYGTSLKMQAILDIQKQLGNRIPQRIDLIDADAGAEAIRSIPASAVAAPVVRATSAG